MPKSFYQNETDIPADQKGAYVSKNGRWELTDLDSDHPTIANKTELETTQRSLKGQITTLTNQANDLQQKLTIAETKNLPQGMVAVAPEIKELGEAAKQAEIDKDEMPTLKTAKADLEKEINSLKGEKVFDEAADALGWKRAEFKRLAKDLNIVAEDVKDGDETVKKFFVAGKDSDNKETKIELPEDENFKPFLSVLENGGGKPYPYQKPTGGGSGDQRNPVDATMAKYAPPASASITQANN